MSILLSEMNRSGSPPSPSPSLSVASTMDVKQKEEDKLLTIDFIDALMPAEQRKALLSDLLGLSTTDTPPSSSDTKAVAPPPPAHVLNRNQRKRQKAKNKSKENKSQAPQQQPQTQSLNALPPSGYAIKPAQVPAFVGKFKLKQAGMGDATFQLALRDPKAAGGYAITLVDPSASVFATTIRKGATWYSLLDVWCQHVFKLAWATSLDGGKIIANRLDEPLSEAIAHVLIVHGHVRLIGEERHVAQRNDKIANSNLKPGQRVSSWDDKIDDSNLKTGSVFVIDSTYFRGDEHKDFLMSDKLQRVQTSIQSAQLAQQNLDRYVLCIMNRMARMWAALHEAEAKNRIKSKPAVQGVLNVKADESEEENDEMIESLTRIAMGKISPEAALQEWYKMGTHQTPIDGQFSIALHLLCISSHSRTDRQQFVYWTVNQDAWKLDKFDSFEFTRHGRGW
jgi:hypothetical protein